MFQMTHNKHSKFHGDRTTRGAITVKKASKNSISIVNDLKLQYYVHNIHLYTIICMPYDRFPHLNNFAFRITAVNQILDDLKK